MQDPFVKEVLNIYAEAVRIPIHHRCQEELSEQHEYMAKWYDNKDREFKHTIIKAKCLHDAYCVFAVSPHWVTSAVDGVELTQIDDEETL